MDFCYAKVCIFTEIPITLRVRHNITIFLSFFALMLLFSSCSTTKYVPNGKLLLKKNEIRIEGDKDTKKEIAPYLIQRPNTSLAWTPIKLMLYNLHNTNYQEKWDKKLLKHRDSPNTFTKVFSLKQAVVYTNFRKKTNEWFIKNGQAPVIVNRKKTKKTVQNLKLHYRSKGYFDATVGYRLDSLSKNTAKITYLIKTGDVSRIDSVKVQIASPVIDSLYQIHKLNSHVKQKRQYKEKDLAREADRLTKIFRNAGVYHFSKYAINYFEIDTLNTNYKTNVVLDISDRYIESGDTLATTPYQIFHISKVKVYTDYSYSKKGYVLQDSTQYNGIDFYAYGKINYNLKHLTKSIFITPNQKYSDISTIDTRKQLRALKGFRSIRIKYEEETNNRLIAHIFLTPFENFSIKAETEIRHENKKPFGVTLKGSIKNKNTFKGNEILQLSVESSSLKSIDIGDDEDFLLGLNAWEWGVDASLNIPRIYNPFSPKSQVKSKMSPSTKFALGYSNQKNVGLDVQRFTAIIGFNWKPNQKTTHNINLFNAQYINNLNVESFFNIYTSETRKLQRIYTAIHPGEELTDGTEFEFLSEAIANPDITSTYPDLLNINKRYSIITEDVLVPSIGYQYTYNTQTNFAASNYIFFKAGISSSGLMSTLFAKEVETGESKQINGINIAQYIKLDLEYIKNWDLNYNNILAFRTNLGVAIPYGNSKNIPFSRSYYAGGPNDIRAWKIYELGPGKENSGLEFNVGNFKLLSSLEYRFDIISSFKGALFIDAGNIWDISNSELTNNEAKFNSFDSLKNTAIGSGFGLRYDLSFLVLRGDLGFKTYVPYETTNKWFNKTHMKPVLNLGINYPF